MAFNDNLNGKVAICNDKTVGLIQSGDDKLWKGIRIHDRGKWQSKNPTIIAEDLLEYASKLRNKNNEILYLISGIGKSGGPPEKDELHQALDDLKKLI